MYRKELVNSQEKKINELENEIITLIEQQSIKEIEYERMQAAYKRAEREKEELEQKAKELRKAIETNQNHFAQQTKSLTQQLEKTQASLVCYLIFIQIKESTNYKND